MGEELAAGLVTGLAVLEHLPSRGRAASEMKSFIHDSMCLALHFLYTLVCFSLIKMISMGLFCITDKKTFAC